MTTEDQGASCSSRDDMETQVIAFLRDRSAPCPRCGYDLRDIAVAKCPECAEPLVLKVGSPRARFGWFLLAIAPGCFSGIAAIFLLFPISMTLYFSRGRGLPWPVICVDVFGFASAATVTLMYRHRHHVLAWHTRKQAIFAASVWAGHLLALALFILAMVFGA